MPSTLAAHHRRLSSALIALCLLIALAGCGGAPAQPPTPAPSSASAEVQFSAMVLSFHDQSQALHTQLIELERISEVYDESAYEDRSADRFLLLTRLPSSEAQPEPQVMLYYTPGMLEPEPLTSVKATWQGATITVPLATDASGALVAQSSAKVQRAGNPRALTLVPVPAELVGASFSEVIATLDIRENYWLLLPDEGSSSSYQIYVRIVGSPPDGDDRLGEIVCYSCWTGVCISWCLPWP